MMDESYSNAYFESSQRRTGGFSAEGTELVISPFPLPWTGFVTVFLPSAFNPKQVQEQTLGFFGVDGQVSLVVSSWRTGWLNLTPSRFALPVVFA